MSFLSSIPLLLYTGCQPALRSPSESALEYWEGLPAVKRVDLLRRGCSAGAEAAVMKALENLKKPALAKLKLLRPTCPAKLH